MDAITAASIRREAGFSADDGDFPGALQQLDGLIRALGAEPTPWQGHALHQLCGAVADRAGLRRYANDLVGALADVTWAEALITTAPVAVQRSHAVTLSQLRTKLHLDPLSPEFDVEAATRSLERLREAKGLPWVVAELEACLCWTRKDWKGVIEHASSVRAKLDELGWPGGSAYIRKRIGVAYRELGQFTDAEREFVAAYEALATPPADFKADVEIELARLRLAQGDTERAWSLAERALASKEQLVGRFRALADQQRFATTQLAVYETAFDVALACGGREASLRAWSVAERAKSFYVCQLVRSAEVPLFSGVDPALIARLNELERSADALERVTAERSDNSTADRRTALYAERETLLAEIMRSNPRWGAVCNPTPFAIQPVIERCRAHAWCPISYFFRERAEGGHVDMHVFASTSHAEPIHLVETWTAAELQQLRTAREKLSGQVDQISPLIPKQLVGKLVPPALRAALPARSPLLFSPHADAHLIPLHALGNPGQRLCDEHATQYVPTLALIGLRSEARVSATRPCLALGCVENAFGDPPLHHVADELTGIHRAWSEVPGAKVHALDSHSDLDAAQSALDEWVHYAHIHLACHGHFPEGRPLDAALRLGSEALRGSELFATRLSARLVSLSACDVGRHTRASATHRAPDEWLGLYLPLLYAGASSLLMSLWSAQSRAAHDLMVPLHERLARGQPVAEAFRGALEVVKSRPESHWANWYLVGIPL